MTMDWKDVIEHFVGDHAQNRDRNERSVVPYQRTSKGKQSVLAAYKGLCALGFASRITANPVWDFSLPHSKFCKVFNIFHII